MDPLTEENIEKEAKEVSKILCDLACASKDALENAFQSQKQISKKIIELENSFKELNELYHPFEYKECFQTLKIIKDRISNVQKRIDLLDKRFKAIEAKLQR